MPISLADLQRLYANQSVSNPGAKNIGTRGITGLVGEGGVLGAASTVQAHLEALNLRASSSSTVTGTSIGETGLPGSQGVTGPSGVGETGLRGLTGVAGSNGPTGPQGQTGVVGLNGSTGPVGQTGLQGFTGPRGFTGVGFTGPIGSTGSIGTQGATGLGFTGLRGLTGLQGSQGTTGNTGITGTQGVTGFGITGPRGFTGIQGFTGLTGVTGFQGPTGFAITGPRGLTGLQGVTGLRGATGIGFATGASPRLAHFIPGNIVAEVPNSFAGETGLAHTGHFSIATQQITSLSSGRVAIVSTSGAISQGNLYWNNTNSRLGVGSGAASPAYALDVYTSSSGSVVTLGVGNSSGTSGSSARLFIDVTNSFSDASVVYKVGSVNYSAGIDGTDLFWKVSASATLGTTNVISLNNLNFYIESGVTANILSLSGTGTRLVTSTSAGVLGNATTIAGSYTWSDAQAFSSSITALSVTAGLFTSNASYVNAIYNAYVPSGVGSYFEGIDGGTLDVRLATSGSSSNYFRQQIKLARDTDISGQTSDLVISKESDNTLFSMQVASNTNDHGPQVIFHKMAGSYASPSSVSNGDVMAEIYFTGRSGSDLEVGVYMKAYVDSQSFTPGDNFPAGFTLSTATADTPASERISIKGTGHMGFQYETPTSPIHFGEAIALPVDTTTDSSVTLDESHHTVIFTGTSGTFNLPSVSGITGRVYCIQFAGSTSLTIEPNSTEEIYWSSQNLSNVVLPWNSPDGNGFTTVRGLTLQCDGVRWWVISTVISDL